MNAQSLRNSFKDLEYFISSLKIKIHIIWVVETWIKESEKRLFNLPNYQAFHSVRPLTIGGGAVIFILKEFDTGNLIYEECTNNNNFLILSLFKANLHIGLCNRQPNNQLDSDAQWFRFEKIVQKFENFMPIKLNHVNASWKIMFKAMSSVNISLPIVV